MNTYEGILKGMVMNKQKINVKEDEKIIPLFEEIDFIIDEK